MSRLPDAIKPAMQGVIPCHVATCALDGTPNVTTVSQIYYVDAEHVALSHQFFNKTVKNIRENPRATAWLMCPNTFETWTLALEFDHSEASGPVFDAMDMQIEAIASMTGMTGVFKLVAADIFRVVACQKCAGERAPWSQDPAPG